MRLPLVVLLALVGCDPPLCVGNGDPTCAMPSPCAALDFACAAGTVEVRVLAVGEAAPGGPMSLASPGDILLGNDQVVAVIEALDHPHYLGPAGGFVLDLGTRGGDDDALRNLPQATGVLPWEAAHYTDLRTLEGEGFAAVQVSGTLDGRPDVPIQTRYEVRPCEPGIRIRTEIVNLEADPIALFLCDAWYWGGRGSLPFTPYPGGGFERPAFGLSTIDTAMREFPFLVGGEHSEPTVSYAAVGCDVPTLAGFQSETVSAAGVPTRILAPGEFQVYERFVAVSPGPSISGAADLAFELRRQLHGESFHTLAGRVVVEGGASPDPRIGAQVRISEGRLTDDPATWTPWTQAIPDAEGRWSARVPPDLTFVVEVLAHGTRVGATQSDGGGTSRDLGDIPIPASGTLRLDARVDGLPALLQAFVEPADDETREAVTRKFDSSFVACAPLLGPPHGPSPACNRVLVDGTATVSVPPGRYEIFSVAGPFSTMARQAVEVLAGGVAEVSLAVSSLPVVPEGALSGDFHVHGRVSFDSTIPDEDRVRAFLAARLDVIAATDHDAAHDYAEALVSVGATDRVRLMVGVETTGHILQYLTDGSAYPQVVGHWNFWPLPYDEAGPWRGAAWDEYAEPAEIMDRMAEAGWPSDVGVVQLNHPIDGLEFGRDLGWAAALGLRGNEPLKRSFDGSPESLFLRTPPGSSFSNSDYHAQEVMNGTENWRLPSYRAFWFYLLSEGVVRAGTANSDSHGLTDNVVGTPRTLVFADTSVADFDPDRFNSAVRDGRMVGTNGPVVEVSMQDAAGLWVGPSLTSHAVDTGAGNLRIRVSAAPWIPVEEIRILVDGEVVHVLRDELSVPLDPLGTGGILRYEGEIPLADLVPEAGDHFIVVEAGAPLVEQADLDCDGFPDTGDHDGNGRIDRADIQEPEDGDEGPCFEAVGPLAYPVLTADPLDPAYAFEAVTPGGTPFGFTNPLLIDRGGDGFLGIGR